MKTKDKIKDTARELFNKKGVKHVPLRVVASAMEKSYGNITYHFSTKEKVLVALFNDLNAELVALQETLPQNVTLLEYFLILPSYSFDLTLKYLFFYVDYIELKRSFPSFLEKVTEANQLRKIKWMYLMKELQKQGYLEAELTAEDLEYIMQLSAGIRIFYFQERELEALNKKEYTTMVNKLLYPYLTKLGKEIYQGVVV